MRQRVDAGNRQPKERVVFLGQGDAQGFQAKLEQARLAAEDRLLAFDLDGAEIGLGERDAAPKRARAGADQVDHHEAVASGVAWVLAAPAGPEMAESLCRPPSRATGRGRPAASGR